MFVQHFSANNRIAHDDEGKEDEGEARGGVDERGRQGANKKLEFWYSLGSLENHLSLVNCNGRSSGRHLFSRAMHFLLGVFIRILATCPCPNLRKRSGVVDSATFTSKNVECRSFGSQVQLIRDLDACGDSERIPG